MSSFTIQFEPDRRLTRVVVTGELLRADGDEIITASRAAASENGSNLLYDVRKALSRVSLGDWFFLPRRLEALQVPEARGQNVAVMVSAAELGDYRFYEDVAKNAGLSFSVFLNEKEALAWLEGND